MKNLQEVAGFFFFIVGSIYFVLSLLVYNHYAVPLSQVLLQVFDLPFILVALLYGGASLSLSLDQNNMTQIGGKIIIFGGVFIIFTGAVAINLLFLDMR